MKKHGSVAAAARYWRLTFNRAKVDNAVEVARVEFFGTAELNTVTIPAAKTFQRPHAIAEANSNNCITLSGNLLQFAIDVRNGCLAEVAYGGKARIAAGYEEYHLENRAGISLAVEYNDRVVSLIQHPDMLEITGDNPGLPGVVIRKRYSMNPENNRLRKQIAFEKQASNGTADFVTLKTITFFDQEYRAGGCYFGADWGLGGRMAASQVKFDVANMVHAGGNSKIGFFHNPGARHNIAQFLLKVNDITVSATLGLWHEKENIPLTYTPYGWKFGLATLPLNPGKPASVEYEMFVYAGDETGFYKTYRATPEIREKYDRYALAPAWLGDVKCSIPANIYHETVGTMRCFDDDGAILGVLNGPDRWGDWIGKGEGVTGYGGTIDCSDIREDFRKLREEFPSGRFGIYCWAWTGSPFSQAFRNHPEWFFSRDKKNRVWSAYGCGCALNFLRDVGNPDSAQALLDGATSIMKNIDSDFFYLDGGCSGTNVIDWPTGKVSQIYDWDAFHETLKETVKQAGEDKIQFYNSRVGWLYDFGYIEGIQNRFSSKWWRDSADSLLALKIRQSVDPLRRVSPLYWDDDSAQYYANYTIGLGLPPTLWDNLIPRIAYISAAYETRAFQLLDGHCTPDWRRDIKTPLELFALRNGNSPVLAAIRHGDTEQPDLVSLDWSKSDLAAVPEQPWYIWKFTLADIEPRIKAKYGVSEPRSKELYRRSGFGVNLVGIPEFLGIKTGNAASIATRLVPERLTLLAFSRGPAWIYSLGGQRTNFFLDCIGNASLEVLEAGPEKILLSRNFTEEAEVLVLLPEDWREITIKGASLQALLPWQGKSFVIIEMSEGVKNVVLTPRRRAAEMPVEKIPLEVEMKNDFRLRVNIPGVFTPVALLIEDAAGVPVYAGNLDLPVELLLPEELLSGKYRLKAVASHGNVQVRGDGEFVLHSQWKYYLENSPIVYGKRRVRSPAPAEITPQNISSNGLYIRQSAIDSSDSFDGRAVAHVDAAQGLIRVGSLGRTLSWAGAGDWSFAGIEVENLAASIAVEAVSNMKNVYAWSAVSPNFAYPGKNSFCGLMIDYHTAEGYTQRVAFSLGKLDPERNTVRPGFGATRIPDRFLVLEDLISNKERERYTLNLGDWAPQGWDGKVWLIAGVEGLTPNRHIEVTFQAAKNTLIPSPVTDMAVPPPIWQLPILEVNKFRADGMLSESFYTQSLKFDHFFSMPDLTPPTVQTTLKLAADDDWFFVAAELADTRAFLTESERLWENDAIDIGFGNIEGTLRQQLIIDAAGRTFQAHDGELAQGEVKPLDVTAGVKIRDGVATIEVAIRKQSILAGAMLQHAHGAMRFNVARYRCKEATPELAEIHSLTPIRQWNLVDPKLFGTLRW